MGLSIEIRNNEVVFVDARVSKSKISVRKSGSFTFPETFLNQTGILDSDNFALHLSQNLQESGIKEVKCSLCLNNNSIIYREIFVPKVDDKRVPFLVRSEMMSALHLTTDYIMDYIPLEEVERNGSTMYRILGVAVLESAIKSYIDTFRKVKLKITIIDSATNAVIKMIKSTKYGNSSAQFIVTEIHERNLRLYLFDEGQYILTRNTKIRTSFLEDKVAFLAEVSESISKMIQFSYTRNSKGLSSILYAGSDEMLEPLRRFVEESLSIEGEIFKDTLPDHDWQNFENNYINAIGVMLRK